jgi:redox-sensitive bicupin YhaK (pirin superfamily)
MSAGTGIQHSEFNPLPDTTCHLLQIWILPEASGFKPRYGQISFEEKLAPGSGTTLALVASRDGREGSVPMHQDVDIRVGKPRQGDTQVFPFRKGRHGWLQVVKGNVAVGDHVLEAGDALAVSDEASVSLSARTDAEFLLFDLP